MKAVFLLAFVLFKITDCLILISEINSQNPNKPETQEFVELKCISNETYCTLDPTGLGPSLLDYYLVFIEPSAKSPPNTGVVVLYANLSTFSFINSTFFLIGDRSLSPDLKIEEPYVTTAGNIYYNGIKESENIKNGNRYPIAALLLKTNDTNLMKDLFEIRLDRSMPLITNGAISLFAGKIIDMVIYGHKAPYSNCSIFNKLMALSKICNNSSPVYRELDDQSDTDFSINNCYSVPACKSFLQLGMISPGCPNDCNGPTFMLEDYMRSLNPNAVTISSASQAPCSSNFTESSYYKISSKKIAALRNQVVEQSKQAGKCRPASSSGRSSVEFSNKRHCTSSHQDNPEHEAGPSKQSKPIDDTQKERVTIPIPEGAECFMKNAANNPTPGNCGEGDDAILHRLSDLATNHLDETDPFTNGVENEAELVLARGNAIFTTESTNLLETYICGRHLKVLGKQLKFNHLKRRRSGTNFKICGFPSLPGITSHATAMTALRIYLTKDQAEAVFDMKSTLVPIGLPLCKRHHTVVKELMAEYIVNVKGYCLRPQIKKTLAESPIVRPAVLQAQCSKYDESFHISDPESPSASQVEKSKIVKESITRIATEGQILHVHFTDHFHDLAESTKQRYTTAASSLMKFVFKTMAPDASDDLFTMACQKSSSQWLRGQTSNLINILESVAECFRAGSTPTIRKHCLSIVAPFVSFSELQRHLPGLSPYYYRQARFLAKKFGFGMPLSSPEIRRIRYEPKKVSSFIDFITSPQIMSDLPYGTSTVTLSSGEKEKVPKMTRIMIHERIVSQYIKFLQENGEDNLALSRSSLLRILDYCTASTRKAVQGLDYITFKGMEAFDNLISIVKEFGTKYGTEWVQEATIKLKESKLYLKGDYKLHVKTSSRIPDHCSSFALSDPVKQELQFDTADHSHDMQCDNCQLLKDILQDVNEKLQSMTFSGNQERLEKEYVVEESTKDIFEWRKHQLRSVHQDLARNDIINNMQTNEVFIQVDWAMKFLPISGREDQASWFGKRGIPWHIGYVLGNISGSLYSRTFVHVFDPMSQDSDSIIAILADTVKRVKKELPEVTVVYVRSDNAGCYHSSNTLALMPAVTIATGVLVKRWDFSEPQFGKGPCDRIAALVKRQVRLFVDQNNKCTNSKEFVKCATAYKGIKGTTFIQGRLKLPKTKEKIQMPGISLYFNFLFSGANKIRAWRSYNTGQGVLFSLERLNVNTVTLPQIDALVVIHENKQEIRPLENANLWIQMGSKKQPKTVISATDLPDEMSSTDFDNEEQPYIENYPETEAESNIVFDCPEEGCIRSFMKHGHLIRHLLLGNHKLIPQRTSLRDAAIHSYSQHLESVRLTPLLPELQEALQVFYESEQASILLEKGWALKKQKVCQVLTPKQRNFLLTKYNEGILQKQKFDASMVAKEMRRNPLFSKEEFLTQQQITSSWSREASRRREEQGTYYDPTPEEVCEEEEMLAYSDPAFYDSHLQLESDLFETDCFEK